MIEKIRIKHKSSDDIVLHKQGIYIIRCLCNNKVYVGQARRPFIGRWLEHQWLLENNHKRCNKHLLNAFNKYGIENFEMDVLEIMPDDIQEVCKHRKTNTKEQNKVWIDWLNEKEIYWIAYYKKLLGESMLFNKNDGGTGTNPCQETRQSISEKHKIIQNLPEVKEANIQRNKERYKDPNEHIKTSNGLKRYFAVKENHDKYLESRKKINYEVTGQKVSKSLQRFWEVDEHHEEHSKRQKEIHNRPEVKHNHSLGMKKRYAKPEEHEKLSASQCIAQNKPGVSEKKSSSMKRRFDKIRAELDAQLVDVYAIFPKYKKLTIPKKQKLIEELKTKSIYEIRIK